LSPRKRWLDAIINEFAPDAVQVVLDELLGSKSVQEAYEFFVQHRDDDWYDLLPSKAQRAIKKLAPINLDWFDTQWTVQAIAKVNPRVASLILGSEELQAILSQKIELLKERYQL